MANPNPPTAHLINYDLRANPQNRINRPEGDQLRRIKYTAALEREAYKQGGVTQLDAVIDKTITDALSDSSASLEACKYVLDCRFGKMPNVSEIKPPEEKPEEIKQDGLSVIAKYVAPDIMQKILAEMKEFEERAKENGSI